MHMANLGLAADLPPDGKTVRSFAGPQGVQREYFASFRRFAENLVQNVGYLHHIIIVKHLFSVDIPYCPI